MKEPSGYQTAKDDKDRDLVLGIFLYISPVSMSADERI
jgi:hypothetical protein